jgi:hypothetical protein
VGWARISEENLKAEESLKVEESRKGALVLLLANMSGCSYVKKNRTYLCRRVSKRNSLFSLCLD